MAAIRERATAIKRGWTACELLAVAGLCSFVAVAGRTHWNLLGPPIFAVTLLIFARGGGQLSRLLRTPFPLWLGSISYSIYMVHLLVQARFADIVRIVGRVIHVPLTTQRSIGEEGRLTVVGATELQGIVLTFVILAMVLCTAALTYRFIEQPGNRFGRSIFSVRRSPAGDTLSPSA